MSKEQRYLLTLCGLEGASLDAIALFVYIPLCCRDTFERPIFSE